MRCGSGRIGCWRSGSRTAGAFPRRSWPARRAADLVVETTRKAYPDSRGAVPLALAAFRGRRGDRWADDRPRDGHGASRPSARVRPSTSPSPACCSMRARARAGPIAMPRDGVAGRPVGGPGAGEPRYVRARRVLVRSAPSAAGRCGGAGGALRRGAERALPGLRRQSARGRRTVAPSCCAGSGRPSPPAPISSRAPTTRAPAGCSTIWRRMPPAGAIAGARDPVASCCGTWGPSGRRGCSSAACRSATAGAIRPW